MGKEAGDPAGDDEGSFIEAEVPEEIDILENWALIEADFRREYGIRLIDELYNMSIREFIVLLNNMSGNTLFTLKREAYRQQREQIVTDPKAVERLWEEWGQ